jgi:hypothetical protein
MGFAHLSSRLSGREQREERDASAVHPHGFTLDETTDLGVEIEGPPDEQAASAARDYIAALPAEQFPNLLAVAEHFGQADNDRSFELLVDLFVDGLAQRVHAQTQKAAPTPR